MGTIDKIRQSNLKLLVSEAGSVKNLALQTGKSSAQLSQWLNASPDSKTGKPRAISSNSAREIEVKTKKPHGWMDRFNLCLTLEKDTKPKHRGFRSATDDDPGFAPPTPDEMQQAQDIGYQIELMEVGDELMRELGSRDVPLHIRQSILDLLKTCPEKMAQPGKSTKKLSKAEYEHMAFMEMIRMRDHGTPEERKILSNLLYAIENPGATIGLSDEVFVIGDTSSSDNTDNGDQAVNGN